jgi:carbamate kinase
LTIDQARLYLEQGHFPSGSMGPKIEAAVGFLEGGGERVVICSVDGMPEAIEGRTGTEIVKK